MKRSIVTWIMKCLTNTSTVNKENEIRHLVNIILCCTALYSQCSGSKIRGRFTHMHNCFLKGGRCCASNNDGTGTVQRCDQSQKRCGYCFTGKPQSSMLDGERFMNFNNVT